MSMSAWIGRFASNAAALAAGAVGICVAGAMPATARSQVQDEVRTEAVAIGDLDPSSANGRVALHYRIGAQASGLCAASGVQKPSQYRACVELAVEEAQKSCRRAAAICEVTIAPFARTPVKPRPTFGPRGM